MKPSEPDEPGSDDYNSRLWRRQRNEKTLGSTQPLKSLAGTSRWDTPIASLPNGSQPLKMCFHQFEEHLAAADDRDSICIWNWQGKTRLNRFSNGNPTGSKINEVRFINEDDQALLMTGSSDGVIKVFRDYEFEDKVELVSAFRGLTDLLPSTKNVGMVFNWQQGQGKILVAGDVKVIRIWNAATEICTGVCIYHSHARHLLTVSGNPCSLKFMHHVLNVRPSCWSHLCGRIWRWQSPSFRPAPKTGLGHGADVQHPQAMDHQRAHAAWWDERTRQWQSGWRDQALGHSDEGGNSHHPGHKEHTPDTKRS